MKSTTAFAPATVANVAVGFDVLGFALQAPGDRVTVTRLDGPPGIAMGKVRGVAAVPLQAGDNTAAVALVAMVAELGVPWSLRVDLDKGIPLSSGLGGSAASAVGAVVALNALLPGPLPLEDLLPFALAGEARASGAVHADNVLPCLLGGLCASLPGDPPVPVLLPVPDDLWCAVVTPDVRIETASARTALSPQVPLRAFVHQTARMAGLVAGCFRSDFDLIARCLVDEVIEPQRSGRIPAFTALQQAARTAGALGCSIGGSGPTVFAWARGEAVALAVRDAMRAVAGVSLVGDWVSPVGAMGARLEDPPCAT